MFRNYFAQFIRTSMAWKILQQPHLYSIAAMKIHRQNYPVISKQPTCSE